MQLYEARKQARYSQEETAGMLGVSRPTYAKMEKYPETVSIADAKKLSAFFGIPIAEIFFVENYN